jgi:hypothetical protein
MSGPEQNLDLEMSDVIAGKPPRSQTYKGFRVDPSQLTGQGSQNWTIDGEAIEYAVNGNANGARDRLLAFFAAERARWMGNELDSTIYGGMHLRAWAVIYAQAVKRGDGALAAAVAWIGAVWFYLRLLGSTPDGQILHVGFRSGGHDPRAGVAWDRATLALALGDTEGMAAALAIGKRAGAGIAISPQWADFKTLQRYLAAMVVMAESWQSNPPDVGFAQPMHFLTWRNVDGSVLALLAYLEAHGPSGGNANTPPLMAAFWQAGTVSWLPAGGGAHFREQLETITMTLAPGLLTYSSDHQGLQTLTLPAGVPEHVVIGGGSPVSPPVPAPPPVNPVNPPSPVPSPAQSPGVDLAAATRLLGGLALSHASNALRDQAQAAIAAGDVQAAIKAVRNIAVNPGQRPAVLAVLAALGDS